MPLYKYRDTVTGETVEMVRRVSERDNVPPNYIRIPIPERIGILGTSSSPLDPHTAEAQVPKAYRQLEEKHGNREFLKESGFSTEEVKRVWNI